MLRQRNVAVVTMLIGSSSLISEQSSLVQASRLVMSENAYVNKDSKKEDEEEEEAPKKDHPPKEVSHFKQADVKKWLKRSWWRDNALPTTPSYNDGDEEAYDHPMGSTFAQKDKNGRWTDGNGAGSEKLDYWWHIDRHRGDPGEDYTFDGRAAKPVKPEGWLTSWNHGDAEPTSHPMGITA